MNSEDSEKLQSELESIVKGDKTTSLSYEVCC